MKVYNTADSGTGYTSIFLYGQAGSGKTPIAATMPCKPIIVCGEPGLKSLQRYGLPYIVVQSKDDAMAAHKWLNTSEGRRYGSIFFDSVSALSENILRDQKKRSRDPRNYSPATTGDVMEVVEEYLKFPFQGRHLVMTCKATNNANMQPGQFAVEPFAVVPKLGPALPYHFDDVLYISRHRDSNTGQEYSMLTCRANDLCVARNRGGNLDLYEPPDLTHIIRKNNGAIT